jgi:DNA segregation ATPase FtsK/SpoIIIE-like protein
VGIHLVVSTQHPSVDVLPGWIKTNMTLRVASKMPNHTASQIIVDSVTAAILPDIPGRMVFRRGGFELLLQTPLIEDDGIARAVKLSREYPAPEAEEGRAESDVVIVPVPKFGRDDLIKTALEHFEGKLTPTRIAQFVGDDVITNHECRKLVHRVVDEITAAGGVINVSGDTYKLGKDRKTYVLRTIAQPLATEAEAEPVSDSAAITLEAAS